MHAAVPPEHARSAGETAPGSTLRLTPSAQERRKSPVERRGGVERRTRAQTESARARAAVRLAPADPPDDARDEDDACPPGGTGLERHRGAGRRLSEFSRSAEEGELTPEQFLFVMAIQEFKRANGRSFPTWTDVLEVIRLLGYRKTQPSLLKLRSAEDWREQADADANVRPKNWEKRAA